MNHHWPPSATGFISGNQGSSRVHTYLQPTTVTTGHRLRHLVAVAASTIVAVTVFTTPASALSRTTIGVSAPHLTLHARTRGILPPLNPAKNIPLTPPFATTGPCTYSSTGFSCQNPCVTTKGKFPVYSNVPSCTSYVLRAVNYARSSENVAPMVLPSNWYHLTPLEQLFVVADLERIARGLPPYLGINAALSRVAQAGAVKRQDPKPPASLALKSWGSTWFTGFSTLETDYGWMYYDGWALSRAATWNTACTSATASGCWAHRDILLGQYTGLGCRNCELGVGYSISHQSGSFTDLVAEFVGPAPPMTFTWARNVKPYLK
jgi:hypothetical protein